MSRTAAFEVRCGSLIVRVCRRNTKQGMRDTVTLRRLFRDGEVWRESGRLGPNDIPLARLLLDKAHTWIYQHDDSDA